MRSRALHLSSVSRLQALKARWGISLPAALIGQFLFQVQDVSPVLHQALENFLKKSEAKIVHSAPEQGLLVFTYHSGDLAKAPGEALPFLQKIDRFVNGSNSFSFGVGKRTLQLDVPHIMGILNVTPDSFSDGGRYLERERAVEHALEMVEQGAEIIDVGGESTRPGSEPVSVEEEMRRVVPVIEAIRKHSSVLISVDTYKSRVAEAALQAGADWVNDISGATFDQKMVEVVVQAGCPLIVMHIKGTPRDMQKNPFYHDVVEEVYRFLEERINTLQKQGVQQIMLDPGIGFGKRVTDNLQLLRDLKDFTFLERPILVGTSRKSFIGKILGRDTDERLAGSLATQIVAVQNGAHVVRVHDVRETHDPLTIWQTILQGKVTDVI